MGQLGRRGQRQCAERTKGGLGMRAKQWVLFTAFLEGLSVLIIEIVGARAIAPYYGTSLKVWTSQITVTLLFLAMGYGLGGRWTQRKPQWALPTVFWSAGAWLVLFPFWRATILRSAGQIPGIGLGSFVAGGLLFGVPLLALGAVSPLLIQRLEEDEKGGGAAAGRIFFTNTMGGLAGGWLAALVLIPHVPLRVILAGTGLALAMLGAVWAWDARRLRSASVGVAGILLVLFLLAPRPLQTLPLGQSEGRILYSHASNVGLIQVMDMDSSMVSVLIDGITQGGMARSSGLTLYEFTEYQAYLSWRYHPQAKSALLLGLGSGLLAKQLDARGVKVEAAEVEPLMEHVARTFFGLPGSVQVHLTDARNLLNQDGPGYDLIFMDAFAGENVPWYLMTAEGLGRMKARLNPGGCLIINSVTEAGKGSPGMERLETGLLTVFGEAQAYVDVVHGSGADLVNACLIAGKDLKLNDGKGYPGMALEHVANHSAELMALGRPARMGAVLNRDDDSDLDHAESALRLKWRRLVLNEMGPEVLGD
jgi:spermidine synthase